MFKFRVILECDGDADAISSTIDSIYNAQGSAGNVTLALLFNRKKYTYAPDTVKIAEELCANGVDCCWNADNIAELSECLSQLGLHEDDVLLFLREGDELETYCLRYIDRFFMTNREICGTVFLPVVDSLTGRTPDFFNEVPPGGISAFDETTPVETRGAAVLANRIVAGLSAGSAGENLADELRRVMARDGVYGRLNQVAVQGYRNADENSLQETAKSIKVDEQILSDFEINQSDILPVFPVNYYENLNYWINLYHINSLYPEINNLDVRDYTKGLEICIDDASEHGGTLKVEGHFDASVDRDKIAIVAVHNNSDYVAKYVDGDILRFPEEVLLGEVFFEIYIPHVNSGELTFYADITGLGFAEAKVRFDDDTQLKKRYVVGDTTIVTLQQGNTWQVEFFSYELWRTALLAYLRGEISISAENSELFNDYIRTYTIMSGRNIWLLDMDTGEYDNALIDYDVPEDIEVYYVVDKVARSSDIGRYSNRHKLLCLFAKKYISGASSFAHIQPFGADYNLIKPLMQFTFTSAKTERHIIEESQWLDEITGAEKHLNSRLSKSVAVNSGLSSARQPLISIIVPIMNVERYLEECLESLRNQSLQNIEIIMVNDGSTDNCLRIMKRYAALDNRFKIISGPNAGYGAAMNKGLNASTGKYIGILESDDFCEPNFYEDLYDLAETNECDLVKSDFYMYYPGVRTELYQNFAESQYNVVFKPNEMMIEHNIYNAKSSIWSAVYNREMIESNNIRFLETPGASYQDLSFAVKTFTFAKRVYLTPNAYVYYRQSESQSVRTLGKPWFVFQEYEEIEKYCPMTPQMLAAKYHNYMFNFNRIGIEHKWLFLDRFSKELKQHVADNPDIVDPKWFAPWEPGHLNIIVSHPLTYYDIRIGEIYEQQGWHIIPAEKPVATNKRAKDILISVIVPCYNVEYYVLQCLESILNQKDADDIEIICVDDCSTDRTLALLEYTARRDARIRVIKNPVNRHVAASRNIGISHAKGKFLLFVDSDDMLEIDAIQKLKTYLGTYRNVNIINFSATVFPADKVLDWHLVKLTRNHEYLQKSTNNQYFTRNEFSPYVWLNLIKRNWIIDNNISFLERVKIGEDTIFLYEIYSIIDNILIVPDKLYRYRQRDNSLMSLITAEKQLEIISELLCRMKEQTPDFKLQPLHVQWLMDFCYRECIEYPGKLKEFIDLITQYGYFSTMPLSKHHDDVMNDFKQRIQEAGL